MGDRSVEPRDVIIGGILTGFMVESALYLKRDEKYKNIFRYARRYPGYTVASMSCLFGLSWMYGKILKDNSRVFSAI